MSAKSKFVGAWTLAWSRLAPRFAVSAGGRRVRVPNVGWNTRGLSSWSPNWKTRLIGDVLRHRPGGFVDVGANVGQTMLDFLAADSGGDYTGFEPNGVGAQHIRDVIEANDLGARCTIVPVGLSDRNTVMKLYLVPGQGADVCATTRDDLRLDIAHKTVLVPVYRLDDLVGPLGLGGLSLVKVDVEGAELAALRGMEQLLARQKPWLLCEVLHRDKSADEAGYVRDIGELADFIAQVGYATYRLVQDGAGARIVDLVACDRFPNQVYGPASDRECDYLLLPPDALGEARAALGIA